MQKENSKLVVIVIMLIAFIVQFFAAYAPLALAAGGGAEAG